MLIVLASPDALVQAGGLNAALVTVLKDVSIAKHPVGVVSNHAEPAWFAGAFAGSAVQFVHQPGRQKGQVVAANAHALGLKPFDALVLAFNDADMQMGKNGGGILVAAGWSTDAKVKSLGIQVASPQELADVIALTNGWAGEWWYRGDGPLYNVRALSDLSGYMKPYDVAAFAKSLTQTVKNGGARLLSLLTVTSRSLLFDGAGTQDGLLWGVYPSSKSANNDTEVLSAFTHGLRTTVSRAHMARRGAPLFIRHTPSAKRSASVVVDRTDPTDQLLTLHLNPDYKAGIKGKTIMVVDDCTTYGVSFGVAAALLRKAGAKSVTGVALGKFGDQLRHYDIDVLADPFQPLPVGGFKVNKVTPFPGKTHPITQKVLQALIP